MKFNVVCVRGLCVVSLVVGPFFSFCTFFFVLWSFSSCRHAPLDNGQPSLFGVVLPSPCWWCCLLLLPVWVAALTSSPLSGCGVFSLSSPLSGGAASPPPLAVLLSLPPSCCVGAYATEKNEQHIYVLKYIKHNRSIK